MSQSSPQETKNWYSWVADRFKLHLKQAKCGHESKETLTSESWRCLLCGIEGGIVPPGPTTEGYTYEAKNTSVIHPFPVGDINSPSVADPVGTSACTHKKQNGDSCIISHAMIGGTTWRRCMRCGATDHGLGFGEHQDAPINMTAAEPQAPFRHPLLLREGGQSTTINVPEPDPALRHATTQLKLANAAMGRRQKSMEDAARAAAAAFDQGLADEAAPVKLDADRKLKVVQ